MACLMLSQHRTPLGMQGVDGVDGRRKRKHVPQRMNVHVFFYVQTVKRRVRNSAHPGFEQRRAAGIGDSAAAVTAAGRAARPAGCRARLRRQHRAARGGGIGAGRGGGTAPCRHRHGAGRRAAGVGGRGTVTAPDQAARGRGRQQRGSGPGSARQAGRRGDRAEKHRLALTEPSRPLYVDQCPKPLALPVDDEHSRPHERTER